MARFTTRCPTDKLYDTLDEELSQLMPLPVVDFGIGHHRTLISVMRWFRGFL